MLISGYDMIGPFPNLRPSMRSLKRSSPGNREYRVQLDNHRTTFVATAAEDSASDQGLLFITTSGFPPQSEGTVTKF